MAREKITRDEIMLEYRIAVLEGTIEWMLSNGVFVKSIEPDEMEKIHAEALDLTKRRYPEAQIEFKGRWSR